jgi:hypothetical protein
MDRQQTDDRQKDIFELTPINKEDFNFFVCMGGRERMG